MFAWLEAGLASLFAAGAVLWGWYCWQRKRQAARMVDAIAMGDIEELWLLLMESGTLGSAPTWFGDPALIVAIKSLGCRTGCFALESLRLLVSRGANVNESGVEWKTALMHAAAGGHREVCEWLLSNGADANARDLFGRTAAYWAEWGGDEEIAALLRRPQAGRSRTV